MNRIQILSLSALLGLGWPAPAQTTPAPSTPVYQTKPPEPDPDPATLKAMRSKIFEIKYLSPIWLSVALRPLGSGVRGFIINNTDRGGINVITVRDFPENLAAIEEAIKRLDVPSATQKAADVELNVHVLFASKGPVSEAGLPADLQEVVKQLKGTLAYRGYTLAASFVQRVTVNGEQTIKGRGELEGNVLSSGNAKEPSVLNMDWEANRGVSLEAPAGGTVRYFLRKFQFRLSERRGTTNEYLAQLETDITLKDGEKVVVGTSVIKGHGLIVVLTARRVD